MLPRALLAWTATGAEVVPAYLTARDHPWLRDLLDAVRSLDGRRAREVDEALRPPEGVPRSAYRMAAHVLRQRCSERPPSLPVAPRAVRAALFRGVDRSVPRDEVLARVAADLAVDPPTLELALLADLRGERCLAVPDELPGPQQLALDVNLALVQGLLARASEVRVKLDRNARALVRQVQLRRLICTARTSEQLTLEISGPYALFRRTTLYGRRLASLVPVLGWCGRFEVTASVHLGTRELTLHLRPDDPLPPGTEPRPYDSKVEEAFARELGRLAADRWEIRREPEAIAVDDALVFPDFALQHRREPGRRWLLEIVGFWTPGYLERKLERLARCGRRDLVLCVDREGCCDERALPAGLPVVWYRRRIDAREVLAVIDVRRHTVGVPDLFIDHAGRRGADDPVHACLAGIAGREVSLERRGARVVAVSEGRTIAVLSARASAAWRDRLPQVRRVVVTRVERRRREQSGADYRHLLRVPEWDLPILSIEVGD